MNETTSRYRQEEGVSLIDIKLATIHQLFNTLDPSPFRDKDLDTGAEDYIVAAVREFPLHDPLKLVIHLPPEQVSQIGVPNLTEAIQNYFDYRRQTAVRDLRFLFRRGRISLAIGLTFLSACLLVRELLLAGAGPVERVVGEGFLIAGWVAMWRPIEIFLYDWWPLRVMGRVYAKLANMAVDIVASAGVSAAVIGERSSSDQARPA
jgi:hypothetical protein